MADDLISIRWLKVFSVYVIRHAVKRNTVTNSAKEAGIGSRLKTPVLPIWVSCVNGEYGVLFNPNKDLMKSYSAENR